ncbi:MAG: hypothetical protein LBG07_06455 [Treponema sp.]|jgi:hypothetical protein|nr:hypothetical protein [Treponema sp.]
MTIDGCLHRVQAALSFLEHIACYYSEEADVPPLSVILSHIEDDVTAAYNECIKTEEERT